MVDLILRGLTRAANRDESIRLSITLNVRGLTITGVLVGVNVYLKRLMDLETPLDGLGRETAEFLGNVFSGFLAPEHQPDRKGDSDDDPRHIHLLEAQIIHPQGVIPTTHLIAWRGSLESVDGWFWGSLQASAQPQ